MRLISSHNCGMNALVIRHKETVKAGSLLILPHIYVLQCVGFPNSRRFHACAKLNHSERGETATALIKPRFLLR